MKSNYKHPYDKKLSFAKTEIKFEIVTLEDNSYHILLPIKIDNIKGDVIIDTGASVSVVDKNIITSEEGEKSVHPVSGSINGEITDIEVKIIKKLKIANTTIRNMQVIAMDLQYVNKMYQKQIGRKIIGLIGCDFCITHNVDINFSNNTLTFRKSKKNK